MKEPHWIVSSLIGAVIGFVIASILNPLGNPITEFSEKNIFDKSPDLRVTLTTTYVVNRISTDIIDLPKTLGAEVIIDENGNYRIIGLNTTPSSFTSLVIENNSIIIFPNFPTTFIKYTNNLTNTEYCVISTLSSKGELEANESFFIWSYPIFEKVTCQDCLSHAITVYNMGNKESEEQRIKVCSQNKVENITGNDEFLISLDNRCFEVRRDKFLEKDTIEGRFIQRLPKEYMPSKEFGNESYNVLAWNNAQIEAVRNIQVKAWNINENEIDQINIWKVLHLAVPNCYVGW